MILFKKQIFFFCLYLIVGQQTPGFSKTGKSLPVNPLQHSQNNSLYEPNVVLIKLKNTTTRLNQNHLTGIPFIDVTLKNNHITDLTPFIKGSKPLRKSTLSTSLEHIYIAHYHGSESPIKVAEKLKKNSLVEYAEPKYLFKLLREPNDSLYIRQSYLQNIFAPSAWDSVKAEGTNTIIAIVDSGTDISHPDLADNIWNNRNEIPDNGIDDDQNGYVDDIHGWNFSTNSPDPSSTTSSHGTHTAGIACGVTNNSIGIAGASWNATVLPVNTASTSANQIISYGYEGILYAAENGAQIISCSWGSGAFSFTGQLIIDHVTELGTIVIASAGNENTDNPLYPASYDKVLSVAATGEDDVKTQFSNYGLHVDVAAPGLDILSTVNNAQYGYLSGTSMSCPLVAGVVALVMAKNEDWLGIQAAEQVRLTSDNIDSKNPAYTGLLGKGRVNAFRAITEVTPSIQISDFYFVDENNSGIIEPAEQVDVFINLKNYLEPANDVQLSLEINDAYINVLNKNMRLTSINTMEEKGLPNPFRIKVNENTPGGYKAHFTLQISSGQYKDSDHFTLTVLPLHTKLSINNIATSVTNIGRIGRANNGDEFDMDGIGFSYNNGPNVLFEGALILGTSLNSLSNATRGEKINENLQWDNDFTVAENGNLQIHSPGTLTDEETIALCEDNAADNPMNIRITQETYANQEPPHNNFILFRYKIENRNTIALDNFYFAAYFDWDVDENTALNNIAGFDAARNLGFIYDPGLGPNIFVGSKMLSPGDISFRAIYNDHNDINNPGWGLYDGFTDEEKWEAISSGITLTEAGPADVSYVIGLGPYSIHPGKTIQVGLAMLAANNMDQLKNTADSAQSLWDSLFSTDEPSPSPLEYALAQNHPNPFNSSTQIYYQLPETGHVNVSIYNIRGQKIITLVDRRQYVGSYTLLWNGLDDNNILQSSGTYLYQIKTGHYKMVRKMLLLK